MTKEQKEALKIICESGLIGKLAGFISEPVFTSLEKSGYIKLHKNNLDYYPTELGWIEFEKL